MEACSHSSAVAIGQRSRLAFRKNGLHAFGGFIEGFLPAEFPCEAVASDDRILAFLKVSDTLPELRAGKSQYILERAESEVRFEASSDTPLPTFPVVPDALPLEKIDLKLVQACLDCVPKTGWGSLNPEMLGVLLTEDGLLSTDNTTLAWAPEVEFIKRTVLPRPFCLALVSWAEYLGDEYELAAGTSGIAALWKDGARLYGALPAGAATPIDFTALLEDMRTATYNAVPDTLADHLGVAAIFSDELTVQSRGATLVFATPGPMTWNCTLPWVGTVGQLTLSTKRLITALQYAGEMAVGKRMLHLRNAEKTFYTVVGAKGGTA